MGTFGDAGRHLESELEATASRRRFGSGWISGVLGLVLGLAGLFIVAAMRAPGQLAMPELRPYYASAGFRIGLNIVFLGAFALSALSLFLRRDKLLGTLGASATLVATLLGGSKSTALLPDPTPVFFGLDWFVLNIFLTGILFIPLERFFPWRRQQAIFRDEWREDLFYYFVSSLMVQVLTLLTFAPSKSILLFLPLREVRAWIGGLPFAVQFLAIMFLTDLVQYWVHRLFHRIPCLWKFHAVHHSARSMDWMAGARMHFLEILALRSTTVIPMYVLGFKESAMMTYIFVVYLYSTFVHANVGWRLRWMETFLVTPRFHHWHHGIEDEAIDVNFAVHFPFLDRWFGTHHMPGDRWPSGYGIKGHPVPRGYVAQFKYPFTSGDH